jgi:fatty acid synthase
MTWEEAHRRCPDGIVPACHNSLDTVTVSGTAAAVSEFVTELRKEGTFTKEVQSTGVAFHSPYITPVISSLKRHLQRVSKSYR